MAYFPFMIEIEDKKCLIVGGGSIAFHKVKLLVDFHVRIQVVAPKICLSLRTLAEEKSDLIRLTEREFQAKDIDGMDFVVAATDDDRLNYYVSQLCSQKNILINAVDMKEACSFIFPAVIKDKDLVIAISTGGQSPAAAAYVKRQISGDIPDYYGEMIETMGGYRDYILKHVDTAGKRKELFNQLLEYGDSHGGKIPKELVQMLVEEKRDGEDNSNWHPGKQTGSHADRNGYSQS
ncbi:MAG: bifunctional precorrin-2 dehydrogenase/sirohydrochlorin ferrochelatase [Lachnospiraceae bacterium]